MDAKSSLSKLMKGNEAFISENSLHFEDLHEVREKLISAQKPVAAILGCSDARVPLEIIFHQGPGDLFVIRIAGNILNDDIIASLEYAIVYLKVNLIMVLGHTSCGAVTTAIDGADDVSEEFAGLLKKIHLIPGNPDVYENVVFNMKEVSRKLKDILDKWDTGHRNVEVVGACYYLDTGKVEVLENNILK